jgi:hypothetical protein
MAEKSSPGTRQTDGKNLVWFGGEIERKLAKLSMPTFTYRRLAVAIMTVLLVSKNFLSCSSGSVRVL